MKTRVLLIVFISNFFLVPLWGQTAKYIDPLSGQSLSIITSIGNKEIATATGFIIQYNNHNYLITNWHVVTGKDPISGKIEDPLGRTPTDLSIWYHGDTIGTWFLKTEPLYSSTGSPKWIEHPLGQKVDVVAVPLSIQTDIHIYPFDLGLANTDMIPEVAMPVSIIGFPFGLSGPGKFPIWKTGHIATEPDLDYDDLPVFLIDATTRPGMSGSPVVLRLPGGYQTKSGNRIIGVGGFKTLFLGIYSAQQPYSEIGKVWKPQVINEILDQIK